VQGAVEILKTQLQNMETHPDGTPSQRHAVSSIRAALPKLSGETARTLKAPTPVVAEIGGILDRPDMLSLQIQCVDPGFDATGVYVVDSFGKTSEFPDALSWWDNNDDRKTARVTGWRQFALAVAFDQKAKDEWAATRPAFGPVLTLDRAAVKSNAKVGLISRSGVRSAAVDLFVAN
jgi:hypothetical protein